MVKQLRPLIGKLDTKKLTPYEWYIVAVRMDEYAKNSAYMGIVIGLVMGFLAAKLLF